MRPPVAATVTPLAGGAAQVALAAPQEAIAPGQACVFYEAAGSRVLGGGWITAARRGGGVTGALLPFCGRRERQALEDLQRRAALAYDIYRPALLANPGVIDLPLSQLEEQRVRVAEERGTVLGFSVVLPRDEVCELDGLFVEPDSIGGVALAAP